MSTEVTVGICAYNEEMNIGKLLHNINFQQKIPEESEILVVCSGCTDNTVEIVKQIAKQHKRIKPILEKERRGKASAINLIFSRAEGSTLIFISADTLPNEDCFSKLISKLKDSQIGIVCGKPIPINRDKSLVGKMVHLLWNFHDHVFIELSKTNQLKHASEVFSIRKGILDHIPIETVNDDAYIALTAKRKGWVIAYEPAALVSICGPNTIPDYIKQRRRIIYGHYQIRKLTGKSPQYLIHLMPIHPIRGLKMTLSLIIEWGVPIFTTFTLLEVILNFLAMSDVLLRKSHIKWSVSHSTKKVKK